MAPTPITPKSVNAFLVSRLESQFSQQLIGIQIKLKTGILFLIWSKLSIFYNPCNSIHKHLLGSH